MATIIGLQGDRGCYSPPTPNQITQTQNPTLCSFSDALQQKTSSPARKSSQHINGLAAESTISHFPLGESKKQTLEYTIALKGEFCRTCSILLATQNGLCKSVLSTTWTAEPTYSKRGMSNMNCNTT